VSELTELYQSVILDHNRRPRNFGELPDANRTADGKNPLCGDQLTVRLRVDGDMIADVRFVGSGCAISKASASLMTAAVKGRSRADVDALFERFHRLVLGQPGTDDQPPLGQLVVFSGVSRFPVRVKCASLAWHTLRAALERGDAPGTSVATE
jgi:nitrogen fixation NifU-like protein